MATPFRYTAAAIVPASGSVSLILEPRGHVDLVVLRMTVSCKQPDGTDPPLQSTALVFRNGIQLEGSYTGNNDADNQMREIMRPGDQLECDWSGATVGARCTFTISGQQYLFGRGPAE